MRKSIPILLFFLIYGCDYGFIPFPTTNAYFEDAYIISAIPNVDANKISVSDKDGKEYPNPFRLVSRSIRLGVPNLIISNRGMDGAALKIWIFQGPEAKCFLYSYTREELIELANKAGFSIEKQNAIFLLERTGIRVVSADEYTKKLEPTFKPHRYDPSLCKSKPDLVLE